MRRSDSGSILVQVAVMLIAVLALSGFVADYGLLWVARRQAQNAADAGAHAGAVAFAFDHDDRSPAGPAKMSAYRLATSHVIAGAPPDVIDPSTGDTTDIAFYSDDWEKFPDECADNSCIRVDVHRTRARANAIPTWFMQLVGVTDQSVKASAIARAVPATWADCLKPWLIPDKFIDNDGDHVFSAGDFYSAPGWTESDIGTTLTLSPGHPENAVAPSDYFQLTQGDEYPDAIIGCTLQKGIGDAVEVFPGLSSGLTRHAVETLIDNNGGQPVTVLIGMFDPALFEAQRRQSGKYDLAIVNIMGFRITGMDGKALHGTIVAAPGEIKEGYANVGGHLIKKIMLIR